MRINITAISGGLGNQMFQYALYLSLKHRYSSIDNFHAIYVAPYRGRRKYELDKVFNIKINLTKNFLIRIFKKCFPILIKRVNNKNYTAFENIDIRTLRPIVYYSGYWQTELYFKNIESVIKQAFEFNNELISPKNTQTIKEIGKVQSVSLHVRRGDYVADPGVKVVHGGICTTYYYRKAIQTMLSKIVGDVVFYIFTDDIKWVKNNLNFNKIVIVDWNRGAESWQDMMLMSHCKHNIVANSSFSWWGAWLNNNKEKIVIAPSKWFNTMPTFDIISENWIRIYM